MVEKTQSGLAFNLFKEQSNNEFLDLLKPLPAQDRFVTFPPVIQEYVRVLLHPQIFPEKVKALVSMESIQQSEGSAVLIGITPADRDLVDMICKVFVKVPNYTKALFLIPRNTAYVEQVLQNYDFVPVQTAPVDKKFEIYVQEFHADFLPIDNDFFLMPCVNSFHHIAIENDFNDLYSSARCLAKIQMVFGQIPQVFTLGTSAERVRDLMNGILNQTVSSTSSIPQIDSLIIIDRSADLITPLMTSFCQESLFDEFFGINYGILEAPSFGDRPAERIVLNTYDEIYQKTRFLPITKAGEKMKERLTELKQILAVLQGKQYEQSEFKDTFLKMNKGIQSQPRIHLLLDLANAVIRDCSTNPLFTVMIQKELDLIQSTKSNITEFAENYVTIFNDWKNALRLLFLESLAGVSRPKGSVAKIQKEIVSEFGLKAHEVFITLEKLKLLSSTTYQGWSSISKALEVVKLDKMGQICDNFVPPTVRAVQRATNGDWPGNWGRYFEERKVPVSVVGEPAKPIEGEVRRVLVFFVGGVALSEAAFIRQMGIEEFNGQVQYIVGSTDSINKGKLMKEICSGFFD